METLRYPTLQAWADGICNAVRAKDGTADPIGHQDLPDRILAIQTGSNIDLSGITAQQPDVSERVQYIDATGELKYGTMPEITAETITLDGGNTECAIDEGHHGGSGKVRIVPETLYAAPSRSTQELDSPAGKVYTKVILDPIPDIYTDVSGADATPAQVLQGSKFVGASGSVEEGGIEIRSGKRFTVTTNGNKSISRAYYDSSAYFEVNVPQTIVSGSGEDSTGTSAVAADIRIGKTARSKGSLVTGTMPDVELPKPGITTSKVTKNGKPYLHVNASSTAETSGFLEEGKTSNNGLDISYYDGPKTITPGDTVQYFATAGKYVGDNLKVEAVSGDKFEEKRFTGVDGNTLQIVLSDKTVTPYLFILNRTSSNIAASNFANVVEYLYCFFYEGKQYETYAVAVKKGADGGEAYLYRSAKEDFVVTYSKIDGVTVEATGYTRSHTFYGDYIATVISEL